MEDNKFIRVVYTLVIGVMVVLFVGVGIATFSPYPKYPTYPEELNTSVDFESSPRLKNIQQQYEQDIKDYEQKSKNHSLYASFIGLGGAAAIFLAGIALERRSKIIAQGLLFGGIFTLVYGIITSLMAQKPMYSFATVTFSLLVVLFLGHRNFNK